VIAPSSAGVYADEPRRDASASVRVTPSAGTRLSARTVAGIKAFVAGGVPGLDADRVTVLDDRGLALDGDGGDDASDVQAALQSALDAAFGPGATIVRVHREPLGERRDVHDIHRAPLGGSLARASSDERYASGAKKYSKTSATEDRGSDTRDEHRVATPGATARLTVAVFVDVARGLDLAKIRALAAAAAGIRSDRGDAVSVEAVAFADPSAPPRGAPAPGWVLAFASVLPQGLTAIALIAVAAIAARPVAAVAARALESAPLRGAARDVAALPPERVRGALEGEPPHVAAALISALPAATAAAVLELYAPTNEPASCGVWRAPTRRCCRTPRSSSVGEFVSLADVLRPPAPATAPAPDAPPPALEPAPAQRAAEPERTATDERAQVELVAALRDARLFRARLGDAFDDARSRLVRELAAGVLARELQLAPCDLDALVQRVLVDAPVVRVRAAPCDVAAIRGVPVVADPELARATPSSSSAGGALDARLGVRLALVLEAFS